jgi:hypothetical protein
MYGMRYKEDGEQMTELNLEKVVDELTKLIGDLVKEKQALVEELEKLKIKLNIPTG